MKRNERKMVKRGMVCGMLLTSAAVVFADASNEFGQVWSHNFGEKVNCIEVSDDGNYIAVGGEKKVYFLNREESILWTKESVFPTTDVSVTADANELAVGGLKKSVIPDGIVYGFNRQGDLLWSVKLTGVSSVSLSSEGKYFAMTYVHGLGWNEVVALWGDNEEKWLWGKTYGTSETGSVSISKNGQYLAYAVSAFYWSEESELQLYDKEGNLIWKSKIEPPSAVGGAKFSVSISDDGNYISAGNDNNPNLYFFSRERQLIWTYETGLIKGTSVSTDGFYIVAGTSEKIYLFDKEKNLLWSYPLAKLNDLAISGDANTIVAAADDTIYLFGRGVQPPKVAKIILISPLKITSKDKYYIGDNIFGEFTIKNEGTASITLEALTTGGRFNNGKLPDGKYPDFPPMENITINPGDSYRYQGSFIPQVAGKYHFFCAYKPKDADWNTSIDLASGLTDEDRIENIEVFLPENQPPQCLIELRSRENGAKVEKIEEQKFFNIYVGQSSDDKGIKRIKFSSDESQDGKVTGTWVEYEWDASLGDWDALAKTKAWSFATPGIKEVCAEVEDGEGQTGQAFANIYCFSKPFSFVHITDVHIGYLWELAPPPILQLKQAIFGEQIDPIKTVEIRKLLFTETLLSIFLQENPDFILITGDLIDFATHLKIGNETGLYREYLSVINNFGKKLKVYTVPGNHDRYANDSKLKNYSKYINLPNDTKDLLNPFNYFFEHKGFIFIGLDSGESPMSENIFRNIFNYDLYDFNDLWNMRGSGLTAGQMQALGNLAGSYLQPKVIFMHHPVVNTNNSDSTITNYREELINYCEMRNVHLVLTGHTHRDHIFTKDGKWQTAGTITDNDYPLFIQTPSATKDGGDGKVLHGYRVVEVREGRVYPQDYTPYTLYKLSSKKSSGKIVVILASSANLQIYDSQGNHTGKRADGGTENNIPDSFYFDNHTITLDNGAEAKVPEMVLLYNTSENYKFVVQGFETGNYKLRIGKAENDAVITFETKELPTNKNVVHEYTINWETLSADGNGVVLKADSNGDAFFERTVVSDKELTLEEFNSAEVIEPPPPEIIDGCACGAGTLAIMPFVFLGWYGMKIKIRRQRR